jgi:hypothetical protein
MIMLRCILFNFCLLTVGIKTEFGASCFELIGNNCIGKKGSLSLTDVKQDHYT